MLIHIRIINILLWPLVRLLLTSDKPLGLLLSSLKSLGLLEVLLRILLNPSLLRILLKASLLRVLLLLLLPLLLLIGLLRLELRLILGLELLVRLKLLLLESLLKLGLGLLSDHLVRIELITSVLDKVNVYQQFSGFFPLVLEFYPFCYNSSMSYFINRKVSLADHIIFTSKIFIPDFNF